MTGKGAPSGLRGPAPFAMLRMPTGSLAIWELAANEIFSNVLSLDFPIPAVSVLRPLSGADGQGGTLGFFLL